MALEVATFRRFTVEEYDRMEESGVFGMDERVELLDGQIYSMPPMNDPHRGTINRLTTALAARFAGRAIVQVQCPIVTDRYSKPEPDFALLAVNGAALGERAAGPADTFAVIEVTQSSTRLDYGIKLPLYAASRVRELWIVDLNQDCINIYRDPLARTFRTTLTAVRGDTAAFAVFAQETFLVDDILPKPR